LDLDLIDLYASTFKNLNLGHIFSIENGLSSKIEKMRGWALWRHLQNIPQKIQYNVNLKPSLVRSLASSQ
jgi:hypothetical protein